MALTTSLHHGLGIRDFSHQKIFQQISDGSFEFTTTDPITSLANRVAKAVQERLVIGQNEIETLSKYMHHCLKFKQDMEEKCHVFEQWAVTDDPGYLPFAKNLKERILFLQKDIEKIHERMDKPQAHYSRAELYQKCEDLDATILQWKHYCFEGNRIYDRVLPALLEHTDYAPPQPKPIQDWGHPELVRRFEAFQESYITDWEKLQQKRDQGELIQDEHRDELSFLSALDSAWHLQIANLPLRRI